MYKLKWKIATAPPLIWVRLLPEVAFFALYAHFLVGNTHFLIKKYYICAIYFINTK